MTRISGIKYTFLLLFFVGNYSSAQCFQKNTTFGDGEKVTYEVSYNWGPIWVNAGEVTFSASREKFLGKDSWHLRSTGKTYSSYDLFFKVRDYYDSWIDPATFNTYEFRRFIYEGGYTLINSLRFDYSFSKIYSNTKRNQDAVCFDTLKMNPCSFDMLGAVYFVRTLDFAGFTTGYRFPVSVIIDDKVYPIYIVYQGKDVVMNQDGKKYRCHKFSVRMVEGTIFKKDEDMMVWVTDDENKIPVYIESKILVGTVKAYLKNMKGLLNPVLSLVRE